jgi:Protein of unknown function (DUF1326)
MAVHSPKRMTDGGWKVALYLDDRASAEQSEALGAGFSGGAGGYLAGLGPLIGEVAGVEPATITFEKAGGPPGPARWSPQHSSRPPPPACRQCLQDCRGIHRML